MSTKQIEVSTYLYLKESHLTNYILMIIMKTISYVAKLNIESTVVAPLVCSPVYTYKSST